MLLIRSAAQTFLHRLLRIVRLVATDKNSFLPYLARFHCLRARTFSLPRGGGRAGAIQKKKREIA